MKTLLQRKKKETGDPARKLLRLPEKKRKKIIFLLVFSS